jgi:hypothetical protein
MIAQKGFIKTEHKNIQKPSSIKGKNMKLEHFWEGRRPNCPIFTIASKVNMITNCYFKHSGVLLVVSCAGQIICIIMYIPDKLPDSPKCRNLFSVANEQKNTQI